MAICLPVQGQVCCFVDVTVKDATNSSALAGARATVVSPEAALEARTGTDGKVRLRVASAREYRVAAGADGFEPLARMTMVSGGGATEVEFLLAPVARQSVTVSEQADTTVAPAAAGGTVTGQQLKWSGADPSRLADALPLIPGIFRSPEGRLRLSGGDENRSTLLLNSVDVTDPATGRFGATVPIDSVAVLNVFHSPFLAEFGRFSASVVSVESRKGGEKWHWELNDPTPEMRIRSARIVGVRGFTPRLSFSGPVVKNRLYFAQSLEYALRKVPSFTQLFPRNEERQESWNGLTQFDYTDGGRHWTTVSLHGVPQRTNFVRPGLYNPLEATPSWKGHEYRGAVSDKWVLGGGLLESSLAYGETRGLTHGQGEEPYRMQPDVNLGNYFARVDRLGNRAQWNEVYSFAPRVGRGTSHWKAGASLVRTRARGEYFFRGLEAGPVRIDFVNRGPYGLVDYETGAFAQNHWVMTNTVSVDYGVRADWQRIAGNMRFAPRVSMSWALFGDPQTVLRTGYGYFYDRVPSSVYSFRGWPERIVDGRRFANVLADRDGTPRMVAGTGLAPQTGTWNTTLEHRFVRMLHLRGGYQESRSRGLIVLQPEAERLVMRGAGLATYRQLEVLGRVRYREGQEFMLSYARTWNRGNLNEFAQFVGDFPSAVVRPDLRAEAVANIPHRILGWGEMAFAKNWSFAPVVEYRTGFPWSAMDAAQQYAEAPQSRRFPNFFSLDFRLSRDISYKGRRFRVSFAMFNTTNHWNPDTARYNIADPLFGQFLGQRARRFRLDFDILN